MRRAPIVIGATAAGLAGVLAFHSRQVPLSVGISVGSTQPPAATSTSAPPAATSTSAPPAATSTSAPSAATSTSAPPAATSTSAPPVTTTPPSTRTATGEAVNYNYGLLSVSVTATGQRITNVKIASIDDGGNGLSQSIDEESIPTLEQEALEAQSANIQSVSGASYTSAGFVQSLQSALTELGLK
jgi:uncharacterized protein with FMN-binding domain